ncbi:MAG: hypothetical protein K2X82_28630 [Gemmataceae bacterium]|nr:hypothetical protein [Gemmataceae bacterium]
MTDEQLEDLAGFEASTAYSELEKDLLRFAEGWTLRGQVDGDVLGRLKGALSPGHLVLLAATFAQANFTSRSTTSSGSSCRDGARRATTAAHSRPSSR